MTIVLNHTIVPARDKLATARFFASIFDLKFNQKVPLRAGSWQCYPYCDGGTYEGVRCVNG